MNYNNSIASPPLRAHSGRNHGDSAYASGTTSVRACTTRALATWLAMSLATMPAFSAQTDISPQPLATVNGAAQAKPNIMLLMDTSGSMGWGHMPDEVETRIGINSVGYKSTQCNVLYYNPALTYALPKQADGTPFPTPDFSALPYARYDAFDISSSVVVNLSTSFKAYDDSTLRTSGYNDTPQPAYYYVHTGGNPITSYTSPACADTDTGATIAASDGGTWTLHLVGSEPSAAQLNFAIWYTYYRTRMSLSKSAASLAFTPLTDSIRVGFITMKPKDTTVANVAINPDKYVAIADFDSTQRGLWFAKLFAQKPGGSSPAREGLARVGRHYAGKQDGINLGMTGDPVQFSCQQNFTIMTTDGYWNDQAETVGGGPVKIDGTTLVGQQDGDLNAFSTNTNLSAGISNINVTPRPIWDGVASGSQTVTNKSNQFAYVPCGVYFNLTTTQVSQTTSQTVKTTSQPMQVSVQNLQSTTQTLKSTYQNLSSTSQSTQSTFQTLQGTNQNLRNTHQVQQSTVQNTQYTVQNFATTTQNLQSTVQTVQDVSQTVSMASHIEETVRIPLQSTTQMLQSTNQNRQSTTQTVKATTQVLQTTTQPLQTTTQNVQSTTQKLQSTSQALQSTVQNLASTRQHVQSTSQLTVSTSQLIGTSSQLLASTSQMTLSTAQLRQSTSQLRSCDAVTELCTPVPVGNCFPGAGITCETVTTGPTLVASCTNAAAAPGNNYVATICATTATGPTPVLSCTAVGASSGNAYTSTSCNPVTTPPTAVLTCNPALANSGNAYTATTCTPSVIGPAAVSACTPSAPNSGNSYTTTTCVTNTTGPTGTGTCTSAPATSPLWTATSCATVVTTNVPVASCTASGPASANSWIDTTCPADVTTTNVPVQTCSNSAGTPGNLWTDTTCSTNNSSSVPVASCTPSVGSSPSWTSVTCPAPVTTGPVGVASCTPVAAVSPLFVATLCTSNNAANVPVQTCTASSAAAGNSYVDTTCPAAVVTGPAPVSACTPVTPVAFPWMTVTCSNNNIVNTPVASCTASGPSSPSWITTTCPAPVTTGPTAVDPATCTPIAATSGNSYVATTCTANNTTNVAVASCSASSANSGNSWTGTSCPAPVVTTNVGVSSCTPAATPNAGNSYTTTVCTPNNAANVPVGSCTPSGPTSGNGWITTTCPAPTPVSGPTAVASCTPAAANAGNSYHETICNTVANTLPSGTCVPQSPTLGNGWVTIVCNVVAASAVPVQVCTPQTGNAGNGWVTITCPPQIVTTNVPVLSCTAAAASAANNWTSTTCPTAVTTGPTAVASCTVQLANAGNSWTSTACPPAVVTPIVAVSSCTPIAASLGNSWTATICGTNNTSNVAVSSCTASSASSPAWTTTTCFNNDTTNVPVASCSPSGPTSLNGWTDTSCPSPVTTSGVPVATCTPAAVATSANAYTTTTCTPNNSLNVASGSCVASPGTSPNWISTTCPIVNTGPTAVQTCTPDPVGNAGNNWTATTCTTNNSVNIAVQAGTCVASGAAVGPSWFTTTCTPNNTTSVPVATCVTTPASSGNSWTGISCTSNNSSAAVAAGTCTPSAGTSPNWTTVTCPIVTTSAPVQAGTCTSSGESAPNWITTTCLTTAPGPTLVATCTPVTPVSPSWLDTTCSTVTSGPTVVATCNPAVANAGNGYTATDCVAVSGRKIQYTMTTTITSSAVSNGIPVGVPTFSTSTVGPSDLDGTCYPPNVATPALPTPNPQAAGITVGPLPAAPCTTWPCTVAVNTTDPRSINSLADVAQYYYATDLRPSPTWPANISTDDVPAVGSGAEDDAVRWQHMTTFTIALGVSGTLNYLPNYKSGVVTTGDFADIRTGAKNWPLWPDPALVDPAACPNCYAIDKNLWNDPKSIDDFWHAAVNGRGSFFSAVRPDAVVAGIADALAGISARVGSAAGAGTSNLEPVPGDNFIYLAKYTTDKWVGEVEAHQIDPMTAALDPTVVWSAQSLLDAKTGQACDTRKIYLLRPGATNNLVNFSWNSRACDGLGMPTGAPDTGLNAAEQGNFTGTNVTLFSQYPSMTDGTLGSVDQRSVAGGANLVNFLRGQRGLEGFVTNTAKLYRTREGVLGDTVNGQPTYVRAPFASYGDPGYAAFKVAQGSRVPMLYVPANDGMLHAFYAGTSAIDPQGGKEAWAIVPGSVLPNLWKLADNNYRNLHQFSVDGTPAVSDIYDTSGTAAWKTVLVAGLNDGGKGYYAVDVTDPASPKGLWEFKWNPAVCPATPDLAAGNTADCHLGLTFGKPLITKIADGTANGKWVVMVTSGYNNVNASATAGDGQGYLYVLDAANGQIIYKISTGVGDATTPSGLAQINNFVDQADINNLTVRVYGTDVLGNIWRFDVNDNLLPAGREATLIGTAKDSSNVAQPITTRPEVSEIGGKPMIFVATGRMLGATDLPDTQVQSIYGIIDPLTSTTAFPNLRAALAPLTMTQVGSGSGAYRTVQCLGSSIQCNSTDGWYVNLLDAGERVNVEMKLRSGTLIAGSNVPQASVCTPNGGYSWLNYFNFSTGLAVNSSSNASLSVSEYTASSLIVGLTVVKLQDGTVKAIVTTSDATIHSGLPPFAQGNSSIKRVSWREIAQ